MAIRFYLVPKIGAGTGADPYRPKYFQSTPTVRDIAGGFLSMDYGLEPVYLVRAEVTAGEHTAIAGQSDVIAAPTNLDATIGAALATVQTALETKGIPAGWITAGLTFRTVLRAVAQLVTFAQRLHGTGNVRVLPPGITLDSTIGDLTVTQRQKFLAAAVTFGLDTSPVVLSTTIRAALKLLLDQLPLVSVGGDL